MIGLRHSPFVGRSTVTVDRPLPRNPAGAFLVYLSRGRTAAGAQRALQVALGLIWLVDGALQFQPFMFGRSFVATIIAPNAADQPAFVAWPVTFAAHLIEPRVALFNAFAATAQVLIGIGLLYRPTVKAALLSSFGWALGVWLIGEGLGGLATGTAAPLTGAPGPALLYVVAGLLLWPHTTAKSRSAADCGLLGRRGAQAAWAVLWFGLGALWLLPANRAHDATQQAIATAPSGARWLTGLQTPIAEAAAGRGLTIAVLAAILSMVVGLAVFFDRWTPPVLGVSVAVALFYFIVGQGVGGVLTGAGTDPGSGPLLLLLAASLYPIDAAPLGTSKRSAARW